VDLSDTESEQWRNSWLGLYPDAEDYLNDYWTEVTVPSGRIRSECSYTEAHNCPFQALAADGIKHAMYTLYREQKLQASIMVHDELNCVTPIADSYNEQAQYLADTMVAGMKMECPNVMIKAEPYAMDRWIKGAEAVYDGDKMIAFTESMLDK